MAKMGWVGTIPAFDLVEGCSVLFGQWSGVVLSYIFVVKDGRCAPGSESGQVDGFWDEGC